MALSPQYSWPEPDNSSLVKNGAQDIRALGDAIDTSVWNVGYGQAGKNKVINGDFRINQRAFTSTTTSATYGFDRFYMQAVDGTTTYSAETFTVGAAPVAGYEAANFARIVSSGQTLTTAFSTLRHLVEDVRTFAGQTATISFWAKAATGTPKVAVEIQQNFGSGGSTFVTTYAGQVTLSTSWARYSVTVAVPSISGKTIGTNNDAFGIVLFTSAGSNFDARTGSLGIQSATIDFWGVQAEYGSQATPFQTATGTLQGELAACQRYYYRFNANQLSNFTVYGTGWANTANTAQITCQFPVTLRVKPTSIDTSAMSTFALEYSNAVVSTPTSVTIDSNYSSPNNGAVEVTKSASFILNQQYRLEANNSSSAFLGWSAEL